MIEKITCLSTIPPSGINCDALLRIMDPADDNELAPPQGTYLLEKVLCVANYRDLTNCLDWLKSIERTPLIKRVGIAIDCSCADIDDLAVVLRITMPNIQTEFMDGRTPLIAPKMEEPGDAFEEGVIASLAGIDDSANPFPPGSHCAEMWDDGHLAAA